MIQSAISVIQIMPVASPVEACAWCWPLLHPGEPYPEQWSSTICAGHEQWILERAQARRANAAQTRQPEQETRP